MGAHRLGHCRTDRSNFDPDSSDDMVGCWPCYCRNGGAIFSHLTVLGIVVMDDGGLLFGLALAVAVCSTLLLFLQRRRVPVIGAYL